MPGRTKVVNGPLTGILDRRRAFEAQKVSAKESGSGGAGSGGSSDPFGRLSAIRASPPRVGRRRAGRGGWRRPDGPAQGSVALRRLRRIVRAARPLRQAPLADRPSRRLGDASLVERPPLRPALRRADPRDRSAPAGQPLSGSGNEPLATEFRIGAAAASPPHGRKSRLRRSLLHPFVPARALLRRAGRTKAMRSSPPGIPVLAAR
jgi:hypothetical protein